jgi:hypothetical protein
MVNTKKALRLGSAFFRIYITDYLFNITRWVETLCSVSTITR